jgi:site-specific recombinase XerD
MQLRGMSEHTRRGYLRHVTRFLEFCEKPGEELDVEDARRYLIHMMREGKVCNSTINIHNSAIRFFFAVTLNRTMNYLQMPMFKESKTLPELLSRDEIQRLIMGCANLKHKAFFLIAYGGGLRVSEIASLKVKDIDSKAMRIFVRNGKGQKDRYTILSNECLCTLRDYWSVYRPKHKDGWLFLGQGKHTHISDGAVSKSFDTWVERLGLGIDKDVSIHSLRHAFATHLLEDGATIFQIKELLGHASLSSTTLYIHLANTIGDIVSPADRFTLHD